MEYFKGTELFSNLHQTLTFNGCPLSENVARKIFVQLISELEYCQCNYITNRDIKLENILIYDQKNIKLIDFGFSDENEHDKLRETYCGTPLYAAPEILTASKYNPFKADIWSIGVVLYTIVCGIYPWPHESQKQAIDAIVSGTYSFPDNITLSDDVKDLTRKMMSLNDNRIMIDEIRQHPWVKNEIIDPGLDIKHYASQDIDHTIVYKISQMGYNNQNIVTAIKNKKDECVVAIYYKLYELKQKSFSQDPQFDVVKDYPVSNEQPISIDIVRSYQDLSIASAPKKNPKSMISTESLSLIERLYHLFSWWSNSDSSN